MLCRFYVRNCPKKDFINKRCWTKCTFLSDKMLFCFIYFVWKCTSCHMIDLVTTLFQDLSWCFSKCLKSKSLPQPPAPDITALAFKGTCQDIWDIKSSFKVVAKTNQLNPCVDADTWNVILYIMPPMFWNHKWFTCSQVNLQLWDKRRKT